MKKALSIIAIIALVISISSCGNKKKKADEHVGTHTHADGTVHRDDAHNHDNDTKPNQESFEVKADDHAEHNSSADGGDHDHGDEAGHDHDHEHGEHK